MVTSAARVAHRMLLVAGCVLALSRPHYCTAAQEDDLRIRVKDKSGKETVLHRKLIVASDGVTFHAGKSTAEAKPVSPFSIFHHLYADDKKTAESLEKDGKLLLRVGKRDGAPIGWLEVAKPSDPKQGLSPDVLVWNTRFMLQPHHNPGKKRFRIYTHPDCKDVLAEVTADEAPKGHRAQVVILERTGKESDETYQVAFFTGKPGGGAALGGRSVVAADPNKIEDMKLDVVFVIDTTRSTTPLIEGSKEVVKRCVEQLGKMPELKGQVRFGLVEYQDVAPNLFSSRLDSPLTADYESFIKGKLAPVKEATSGSMDTPNDVLAGLKTAITDSGWDKNGSRHIILIGNASAHIGESHCSPACAHRHDPKTGACSGNSTGLDIKRIIGLGRPAAGSATERALRSITFSAVRIKGEDATDHAKCREQFKELARNNGECEGRYIEVEDPNKAEDRQRAVKELTDYLLAGFTTLQKVRLAGGNKAELRKITENAPTNAVSASIFSIVKSQIGEVRPVVHGFAVETTGKGDRVAEITIQVERAELDELRSSVDLFHTRLKGLADPQKRKNTGALLTALQCAIATVVTGEVVGTDTNQDELLAALPVTTPTLKLSPEALAKMTEAEFRQWLTRLDDCKRRYEELMASKDWDDISDGNSDEKYLFLRRTELP